MSTENQIIKKKNNDKIEVNARIPVTSHKRAIKIFKNLIKYLILILFISIFGLYIWISEGWRIVFSDSEMKTMATEINSTPSLSQNFYKTYDKLNPTKRNTTMNQELLSMWKTLFNISNKPKLCICHTVYHNLELTNDIAKKKLKKRNDSGGFLIYRHLNYFVGWGLQNYSTPEKCFDYYINSFVSEAKNIQSTKALNELLVIPFSRMTEDQIIEFIILMKAPSYYDKYKNPKRFQRVFLKLKDKLNTAANK